MAWALAISLIFISMLLMLTILYLHLGKSQKEERNPDGTLIPQRDRHIILRIGIIGLMASYALATVGLMPKLLSASNINDSGILSVVNSAVVVIGAVIYIFLAYLVVYIAYYFIKMSVENTQAKKRKRVDL